MSPDAYWLHEVQFLQERSAVSAPDALSIVLGPVPEKKIWTLFSGNLGPSVPETRTWFWFVYSRAGTTFPVTTPTTIALDTLMRLPLLNEGMELKLFPGEMIFGRRSVATAGSTMSIQIRFIESDVPFYSYAEPQKKLMRSVHRRGTAFQGGVSGGEIGGPSGGESGGEPGEPGERGGPQPV